MPNRELDTFAPNHLKEAAKKSGFFQCKKCGLVWFGKPDATTCPEAPSHRRPVHVALLCRICDLEMPIELLVKHLNDPQHHAVEAKA
jgi:hypothetical protein